MQTMSAATPPTLPPMRRRVFRVALSAHAPSEINFKELLARSLAAAADGSAQPAARDAGLPPTVQLSLSAPAPPSQPAAPALAGPRSQRYNIIERLEKRYGGGAVVDCSESADGGGGRGGDEDDYYDSEDSFIDDEELQQDIEEIHGQARVKTKHAGFFVNAGDEIETLERDDNDDADDAAGKQRKKSRKSGAESSKSVKGYLDEWSEAASDWNPEPEVVTKMEALRAAVRELEQTAPITKVFPRKLDDALRAVDILVVEAHPNKWRVNGYFATLMTFLPFTKQYLKSNMLRLEARDNAQKLKDDLEKAFQAVSELIAVHVNRTKTEPLEQVKEGIVQDRDLAEKLRQLLSVQDEWATKENDYRQMLKTEDKKHLKEQDYAPLNSRQEKNRCFSRVLALFSPPVGLMDLPTLRGMNKSAKSKPAKKLVVQTKPGVAAKPAPVTATAAATPAVVKRNKSPTVAPLPSPTVAKKGIKPFKSRMMDETPPFSAEDFEEIE